MKTIFSTYGKVIVVAVAVAALVATSAFVVNGADGESGVKAAVSTLVEDSIGSDYNSIVDKFLGQTGADSITSLATKCSAGGSHDFVGTETYEIDYRNGEGAEWHMYCSKCGLEKDCINERYAYDFLTCPHCGTEFFNGGGSTINCPCGCTYQNYNKQWKLKENCEGITCQHDGELWLIQIGSTNYVSCSKCDLMVKA